MHAHAPLLGPRPRVVRVEGMHLLSGIMGKNSKWINRTSSSPPITPPLLAFRRKLFILRLLVLKLDAHLEAAAEKSCSVFWERTNYPD